jgi:hypothetical protein
MKRILVCILALSSFVAQAKNCRISGRVTNGFRCHGLTVKVDATDEDHCKDLTLSTIDNNFFNQLGKRERLLAVRFKFKEGSRKVKEEFELEDSKWICAPIRHH